MSENALSVLQPGIDARTLAQLTGQDGAFNTQSNFARVRINTDYETEDEEGNTYSIPPGSFAVKDADGVEIYSKTAVLRPLLNRLQYRRYDPKGGPDAKGATVAKTILVAALGFGGEEALDDQGGIACGKLSKRDAAKGVLSAAQQLIQEQTKAYRYVYGLLTMTGVDKHGATVELVDYPVLFRMRGVNYMPIGEVFDKIGSKKGSMQSYPLSMSLKKDKNGDTVFFRIQYEYDPKAPLPLTQGVLDTIREAVEEVEDHNSDVRKKYSKARKGGSRRPANDNEGSALADDFLESEAA
jgi:hypothetical protein